ncbi:MAG: RagB/SusD family nutrient uptake outer membrane protein [Gemmatimonadaceae bacterium]
MARLAGPDHGNDYAYFRLAEIYLIKAEALTEMGRTAEALQLLNVLRSRVFEPAAPLASANRDVILRERLFELTAEAKRRQDLIRHGRYTDTWQYKAAWPGHVILMPIPQKQINANPLLVQNPGY